RRNVLSMRWFGFGFNAFGQICVREKLSEEEGDGGAEEVKVFQPTELSGHEERGDRCVKTSVIRACWSRRASLNVDGESYNFCFSTEPPLNLPLVPGGYISLKPPFYHSLSPHLKARSLALGAEHAILLSAAGVVYTWGLGSHGQLGHGVLTSEEEPRAVEALWGMPMRFVATGGWHSVCISDGGDLYVWGWNESGQLGLPSRGLSKAKLQQSSQQAEALNQDTSTSPVEEPQEGEKNEEVFISIQAFPALLDVTPSCEIKVVSCGSRHTAAVTTAGELYTWGWGEYGQLGHQNSVSSDEPQRVEYFREQQERVVDVVCGAWNTFAAVINKEVACS
uniref:Uncharacterized protein n=1 Tax=Anabas testudineus TaxID=64144 RepID=A0A3Q1JA32_ANATE